MRHAEADQLWPPHQKRHIARAASLGNEAQMRNPTRCSGSTSSINENSSTAKSPTPPFTAQRRSTENGVKRNTKSGSAGRPLRNRLFRRRRTSRHASAGRWLKKTHFPQLGPDAGRPASTPGVRGKASPAERSKDLRSVWPSASWPQPGRSQGRAVPAGQTGASSGVRTGSPRAMLSRSALFRFHPRLRAGPARAPAILDVRFVLRWGAYPEADDLEAALFIEGACAKVLAECEECEALG